MVRDFPGELAYYLGWRIDVSALDRRYALLQAARIVLVHLVEVSAMPIFGCQSATRAVADSLGRPARATRIIRLYVSPLQGPLPLSWWDSLPYQGTNRQTPPCKPFAASSLCPSPSVWPTPALRPRLSGTPRKARHGAPRTPSLRRAWRLDAATGCHCLPSARWPDGARRTSRACAPPRRAAEPSIAPTSSLPRRLWLRASTRSTFPRANAGLLTRYANGRERDVKKSVKRSADNASWHAAKDAGVAEEEMTPGQRKAGQAWTRQKSNRQQADAAGDQAAAKLAAGLSLTADEEKALKRRQTTLEKNRLRAAEARKKKKELAKAKK